MYTILVNYTTGNSFGSEKVKEEIGLCWKDKNLARKCLKAIKEHYSYCKELDDSYDKNIIQKVLKEVSTKEWFQNKNQYGIEVKNSFDFQFYGCRAQMDDGSYRTVPTSIWVGCFETLHGARVVVAADSDTEDEDSWGDV